MRIYQVKRHEIRFMLAGKAIEEKDEMEASDVRRAISE